MNMERAKNIIIIMLVAVNAALFGLIYRERGDYVLQQSSLENIRSILAENNIAIYAFNITDFSPKRQLAVKPVEFSDDDILSLFFSDASDWPIDIYADADGFLYENGVKSAFVSGNVIDFTDDSRLGTGVDERDVYGLCDKIITKISAKYPTLNLRQDYPKFAEDGRFVFEYRAVYKDFIVYQSVVRVTIEKSGSVGVYCVLSEPSGFTGDNRQVYSSDEALFQLMYQLKGDYSDAGESIKLTNMDVVYAFDEIAATDETIIMTPYYRFYIRPGGNERIRSEPYLINAYNNTILY